MEDKKLYTIFVRIVKGLLWGNLPPKRDIMTVLSKRCGVSREAARELALQIRLLTSVI